MTPSKYLFGHTGLMWSMIGASTVIGAACFVVVLALLRARRRHTRAAFQGAAWRVGAFAFAFGGFAGVSLWTLWQPEPAVLALTQWVAAACAIAAAIALWRRIPKVSTLAAVAWGAGDIGVDDSDPVPRPDTIAAPVTPHRLADEASNRLAAIVESSYDAIIGKTLDGRITSWNAAAQALFGYSADEAVGQPIQMLIPPEREAEEMHILTELARGRRVPAFDTVRRAKDGRLIEVALTISPIRDAHGRIVGAAKIARDVSRQRRAEAALRDSEAQLRFTLDAAQIGDWNLDLASGVAHRSLRHDRCFGYDTLQPTWDFDTFLRHVHPDDRADVLQGFQESITTLRDWSVECRVVWPDASVHWIGAHGSIVHEAGKPARMLGIVTDITPQKFAEQARLTAQRLEAENHRIREANRHKSQFLANMSHELRTPLNLDSSVSHSARRPEPAWIRAARPVFDPR